MAKAAKARQAMSQNTRQGQINFRAAEEDWDNIIALKHAMEAGQGALVTISLVLSVALANERERICPVPAPKQQQKPKKKPKKDRAPAVERAETGGGSIVYSPDTGDMFREESNGVADSQ